LASLLYFFGFRRLLAAFSFFRLWLFGAIRAISRTEPIRVLPAFTRLEAWPVMGCAECYLGPDSSFLVLGLWLDPFIDHLPGWMIWVIILTPGGRMGPVIFFLLFFLFLLTCLNVVSVIITLDTSHASYTYDTMILSYDICHSRQLSFNKRAPTAIASCSPKPLGPANRLETRRTVLRYIPQ
jgi:hypothetical protein